MAARKVRDGSTQLRLVQFMHPGLEFMVQGRMVNKMSVPVMWRKWSTLNSAGHSQHVNHRRRLVRHRGQFVAGLNGELEEGDLAFWTEWEGPTRAMRILCNEAFFSARFQHEVQFPSWVSGSGVAVKGAIQTGCGGDAFMDTDPCVFGRTFKYAICQQKAHPTLHRLATNSLIVFGSYKKNQHGREVFCLDTVFVVDGEGIDYTYSTINGIGCSEAYKNLSLRRVDKDAKNTFYRGVRYGMGREIFSFTPAKRVDDEGFSRRCVIDDVETLNLPGIEVFAQGRKQGFCSQIVETETVRQTWRKIVDQVLSQGFVLGVGFDWPKLGSTR